jgi:hypothetical protein
MSKQIKKELQESDPKMKMKEKVKNELLEMVNEKLKLYNTTIPDSPLQLSVPDSPLQSKMITMIGQQSASNYSEDSEIKINPVITGPKLNWRKQTKLYYPRATAPDLLLEEKDSNFKSFSANNL